MEVVWVIGHTLQFSALLLFTGQPLQRPILLLGGSDLKHIDFVQMDDMCDIKLQFVRT